MRQGALRHCEDHQAAVVEIQDLGNYERILGRHTFTWRCPELLLGHRLFYLQKNYKFVK